MKVLFIGDIVGSPGRQMVKNSLAKLRQSYSIDFVFCNGENSAGGLGITATICQEILSWGIDGVSLGNHIWGRREWLKQAYQFKQVCRPLNAPPSWPGYDHVLCQKDGVTVILVSLMGRAFIQPVLENPFLVIEDKLTYLKERYQTKNIVMDFHAETTAEKISMAYFVEDKVTAVLGTHTHVQTADEKILGNGTAFITDVGMTGPAKGVLGMSRKVALNRAVNQLPAAYQLEDDPSTQLNAVLLEIDPRSGQARDIKRINLIDDIYS